MQFCIKNSPKVSPIISFFIVASLIVICTQYSSINRTVSLLNPNVLKAQVVGFSGPVFHLSSCPASKYLYTELFSQLKGKINGVSIPSDATTNVNRDPNGSPSYYLRTWPTGLNFTGHSIVHTATDFYGFTLISPRHALTAWHLNGYGVHLNQIVLFRGTDGVDYTRTVVGLKEIGSTDLALVVFDSDLPSTVAYYPVISSSDLSSHISQSLYVPMIFFDQLNEFLIRKIDNGGDNTTAYSSNSAFYPFGLEAITWAATPFLSQMAYDGDSGHPSFFLINNTLILVSVQHGGGIASMVGAYIPEINQAMTDLGNNPNIYQVTTLDMSCFNSYTPPTIQSQTFTVDRSAANGTVVGKVAYSQSDAIQARGFTINSGNESGAFSIDSAGQILVANSAIFNIQNHTQFTLNISMTGVWAPPDDQVSSLQGSVTINVTSSSGDPYLDVTPPTVTAFLTPSPVTSLTIPVSSLTAVDSTAVTGYMITESSTKPLATASGWSATAPASYTVASGGAKTLYAWAKDAAGNVSNSLIRRLYVNVTNIPASPPGSDMTIPIVTTFTVPTTASSLTVPITVVASDPSTSGQIVSGVSGYMVTESDGSSQGQTAGAGNATSIYTGATTPSSGAAGWLSAAPTTYTFASAGTKTLYAWAKDGSGNVSVSRSAVVTVTLPVNIPRVTYTISASAGSNGSIAPSGSVTVNSGSSQAFIVSANPGYQISNVTVDGSGVSLTANTYTLSNISANHTIVASFSAQQSNHAPTFTAISDKSVNENSSLSFTVSASDPDGDVIAYSTSNMPSGATFNFSNQTFSWTPTYSQSGNYAVTFTATDSHGASASKIVTVSVINLDRSPVAEAGQDQTVILPATASLSAAASSDPDADSLTYSWSKISGPGSVTFSNLHNISPTATFSQAGSYVLEVSVSDGSRSSTDRVTVTASSHPTVTYTIDSSYRSNGSVVPSGIITVSSGSNQTFTIVPNAGYQVSSFVVDGNSSSLTNGTYTFSNISANHTISANFSAAVDSIPPSLYSIGVSNVTKNSVEITWDTNELSTNQVKYGLYYTYGQLTSLDSTRSAYHSVILSGLTPSTTYHYAVISTDGSGNSAISGDGMFSTLADIQAHNVVVPPVVNNPPANVLVRKSAPVSNSNQSVQDNLEMDSVSPNAEITVLVTPPSIPTFLWSFTKNLLWAVPSGAVYVFDRVVSGVKNVLKL